MFTLVYFFYLFPHWYSLLKQLEVLGPRSRTSGIDKDALPRRDRRRRNVIETGILPSSCGSRASGCGAHNEVGGVATSIRTIDQYLGIVGKRGIGAREIDRTVSSGGTAVRNEFTDHVIIGGIGERNRIRGTDINGNRTSKRICRGRTGIQEEALAYCENRRRNIYETWILPPSDAAICGIYVEVGGVTTCSRSVGQESGYIRAAQCPGTLRWRHCLHQW